MSERMRLMLGASWLPLLACGEVQVILNDDKEAISEDPTGAGKYQDLLNWAVTNSDPDALKNAAAKHDGSTVLERLGRDVYDAMFAEEEPEPEENINLVEVVGDPKTSDEDLVKALEMLEDMVTEPDLANGLYQSGALGSIAEHVFSNRPSDVKLNAAWVLGTACQNNEDVQMDLLSLDMCRRILEQFQVHEPHGCGFAPGQKDGDFAVCQKLQYFTSAFVRNSRLVQIEASDRGVFTHMMEMFSTHIDMKVVARAATFLETVSAQDPNLDFVGKAWSRSFFDAAIKRVKAALSPPFDVDTAERVFELLSTLNSVRSRDEHERDALLQALSTEYDQGLHACNVAGAEHKLACERLQSAWGRLLEAFGSPEQEEPTMLLGAEKVFVEDLRAEL